MHRTDKPVADFFDAGLLKLKLIKAKPFSMAEDCNAVSLCEIPQGTETRFRFGACMGIMVESVSRTPTALRGLRDFEWVSVRLPPAPIRHRGKSRPVARGNRLSDALA